MKKFKMIGIPTHISFEKTRQLLMNHSYLCKHCSRRFGIMGGHDLFFLTLDTLFEFHH
jgi:hypothetical protein